MADKGLCVLAPLREPAVFLFFILGVPPEEVFHTSGVGLSATSPRYAVGFTLQPRRAHEYHNKQTRHE